MSKRGYATLIWGGLLIIIGLLLLAENLDLLGDWKAPISALILGAFALAFLAIYVGDREQWWALIPGLAIAGVAVAVFLAEQELIADYVVATTILSGVALPFLLIFVIDRRHWWALIPGFTMAGIAVAVYLEGIGVIEGASVGGFTIGGISLGFLSIYLIDRKQWWALIPGGIMGVMAFFMLLATATEFILPATLILIGLLLLRNSLRGSRRRAPTAVIRPEPTPSIDVEALDRGIQATTPESRRLPTLEEQIQAAVAEGPEEVVQPSSEETEATGLSYDMPTPPEMPDPPDVPSGSDVL